MAWSVYIGTSGAPETSIEIESVTLSYLGAEQANLVMRHVRHDATVTITNNDLITIKEGATTRFSGWVRTNEPGGVAQEGVSFRAFGPRWMLDKEIDCRINGSREYQWDAGESQDVRNAAEEVFGRWTTGQILVDILEHAIGYQDPSPIPKHHTRTEDIIGPYLTGGDIIASFDAAWILANMTTKLAEFSISGTRLGEVISQLVQVEPNMGWYVDPDTKALVIRKFASLDVAAAYAGEIGQYVDSEGQGYNLLDNKLAMSLEDCYTQVTIQGADKTVEVRPECVGAKLGDPVMIPAWKEADEIGWDKEAWENGEYIGTGRQYVYRAWVARAHENRNWVYGWMTDDNNVPYAPYTPSGSIYKDGVRVYGFWCYHDLGTVIFMEPKDDWGRINLEVWARVRRPFTVTVGPSGSAYDNYGVTAERTYVFDRFEHKTTWCGALERGVYGGTGYDGGTDVIRDDTTIMTAIANQILAQGNFERIGGDVTLHATSLATHNLDHRLNIQNLAKWGGVNFYIFQVTIKPHEERVIVTAGNSIQACRKWSFDFMAQKAMEEAKRRSDMMKLRNIRRVVYRALLGGRWWEWSAG